MEILNGWIGPLCFGTAIALATYATMNTRTPRRIVARVRSRLRK